MSPAHVAISYSPAPMRGDQTETTAGVQSRLYGRRSKVVNDGTKRISKAHLVMMAQQPRALLRRLILPGACAAGPRSHRTRLHDKHSGKGQRNIQAQKKSIQVSISAKRVSAVELVSLSTLCSFWQYM